MNQRHHYHPCNFTICILLIILISLFDFQYDVSGLSNNVHNKGKSESNRIHRKWKKKAWKQESRRRAVLLKKDEISSLPVSGLEEGIDKVPSRLKEAEVLQS